jgi:hypothetical protein
MTVGNTTYTNSETWLPLHCQYWHPYSYLINKKDIFLQYSGREALMCYQALPINFISAHLYMDKYERKPGAKL